MSADLFAEFNSSSNASPPPPPQQPKPSASASASNQGQGIDWFQSFGSSPQAQQPPARPAQPAQQPWSFSQGQAGGGMSGWGNPAPAPPPQQQPQPSAPKKDDFFGGEEDDDGWGDFETAHSAASPAPAPPPASADNAAFPSFDSGDWKPGPQKTAQPPPTRLIRASTMDLMTNNLVDIDRSPVPSTTVSRSRAQPRFTQQPAKPTRNDRSDANVLFDVADFELGEGDIKEEDEEDMDDFGDFETSAPGPAQPKSTRNNAKSITPSMDLLSLGEPEPASAQKKSQKQPPPPLGGNLGFGATNSSSGAKSPFLNSPPYPQAPKSPSFQDRNPFPDLAIKTPTKNEHDDKDVPRTESPVTAWPSMMDRASARSAKKDDDGWGAWEDFQSPGAGGKAADIDDSKPPESWDWDAADNVQPTTQTQKSNDADPPPINVPPPSVILSIFPELINSGGDFFKPMSKQSVSIKQQVLSDPKAVEFLHGYILLATTAARVIAGRKHRWHRDKILAKSMSISAAGSKGMKLAGVDKTQSAREDREAADVAAVWQDNVGRLRSAVAAANAAGKASLKVPELSGTLQIQTAKMVPTAPKPCIVCGLKREERITKVDFDVEDSFGEWWVEHWGHRACKNFWTEHEQKLRQR